MVTRATPLARHSPPRPPTPPIPPIPPCRSDREATMSEDEQHHQLDEPPPGDARDPARSEVGPDTADPPSADPPAQTASPEPAEPSAAAPSTEPAAESSPPASA